MHHVAANDVVVRFNGVLDCEAARSLLNTTRPVSDESWFIVDISEAHDADDSAVALLASALSEATHPFLLRGLSNHQERVLRYLGMAFESQLQGTAQPAG